MSGYMQIFVDVTQDHIDKGEPNSPCDCPVALALRDAGVINPSVYDKIGLNTLNADLTSAMADDWVDTPSVVGKFVSDFDEHLDVEPFTFQLVVHDRYLDGFYVNGRNFKNREYESGQV